jgi:hypothetical protein
LKLWVAGQKDGKYVFRTIPYRLEKQAETVLPDQLDFKPEVFLVNADNQGYLRPILDEGSIAFFYHHFDLVENQYDRS